MSARRNSSDASLLGKGNTHAGLGRLIELTMSAGRGGRSCAVVQAKLASYRACAPLSS